MLDPNAPLTIVDLIAKFRKGDTKAADELVEILYPQLRRMAATKMRRERGEHSWQPTLLVNELYLELLKIKALPDPGAATEEQKAAFLGFAGFLMNRLLARHARPISKKAVRVELKEEFLEDFDSPNAGVETLAHIEKLLSRLEAIDSKFRTVVELKAFEGFTVEEIAARMDCSQRTVRRYWTFASHWLQKELAHLRS